MAYGGHASSLRVYKVNKIFSKFDLNGDGHLNREEMAALVVAVNPKVDFNQEQIASILDEIFRTYGDYIDGDEGLSFDGLLQTYHDGAGDIDRDFNALGLKVDFETEAPKKEERNGSAAPLTSSADDSFGKKEAPVPSAESPKNDDGTWDLLEELEALIRQVENKMNEKMQGDQQGGDSRRASVGWVRDMGAADGSASEVVLSSRPWEQLGQEYVQFRKGVAEIRRKADQLPTQEEVFEGHMAAGRTLFDHQLFKEAMVSFRRASELKPTDMRPLFQEGNALYALDRVSDAREAYTKALETDEVDMNPLSLLPQIHVNLGIALETDGLLLSASEHYREAVMKAPKHYRALKLLGSALFGVGEYQAAKENLMEAISLHADYADAHCELGLVLHALGDYDQARLEFQKTLDLRSDHVEALYNLATLQKDTGQYGRAAGTYLKVLSLQPGNWRAQLNRAVALLGIGDMDESKSAFKQAYKMTGRSELYDAMIHLQNRNKVLAGENFGGEETFFVVEPARFKTANERTTTRQWLSYALDIRDFQKCTRLNRCDVANLKKEMSQATLIASPSHVGMSEKLIRKEALEKVIRNMLHFLKPDAFRGAMKMVNEKILSVLDPTGSGRVDTVMVSAILAPICGGSLNRRKKTVFDALVLHSSRNIDGEISRQDAKQYLKLLRTVYLPAQEESEHGASVGNHHYASLSFPGFVEMFDDPDSGFGLLNVVAKLELEDHVRHGGHICSVCCYPIIGSRFKETKVRFSLCSLCYSSGKVPSTAKRGEFYYFKEYNSELEAAKDKLLSFKSPLSCSAFSR